MDYRQAVVLCEITYECACAGLLEVSLSEVGASAFLQQDLPWPFVGVRAAQASGNVVRVDMLALAHSGDHVVQEPAPLNILARVVDALGDEGVSPPEVSGPWQGVKVQELQDDIGVHEPRLRSAYMHFTRSVVMLYQQLRLKDVLHAKDRAAVCADGLLQVGVSINELGALSCLASSANGGARFAELVAHGHYDQFAGHPALVSRMVEAQAHQQRQRC